MPTGKSRKSRSRKSSRSGGSVKSRSSSHKDTKKRAKKKPVSLRDRNMESLQAMARSHGVPFGGLSRTALIDKLMIYGY